MAKKSKLEEVLEKLNQEDLQVVKEAIENNKALTLRGAIVSIMTRNLSHGAGKRIKSVKGVKK